MARDTGEAAASDYLEMTPLDKICHYSFKFLEL